MPVEGRSWLITGGCGFIGTNLIAALLEENPLTKIRVLDNLSVGQKDDLAKVCNDFLETPVDAISSNPRGVELVIGDVREADFVSKTCKGIDIIVHLAANSGVASSVENPRLDCEVNVIGTLNLLEAARHNNVQKFIFASSGAPLGEQEPPIHEQKVPRPVSPYGASKLAGEGYCSAYYRTFGLSTIALRFGNVYGPRSKHKSSVVAKFIQQALRGEVLEIYGDGQQTRDFIYIKDLVKAIRLAADSDVGGEVFQIATYRETTVNELTEQLTALLRKKLPQLDIRVNYGSERLGDVKRNYSDISKARKILGFQPQYDLRKGLEETIDWFLSQ
ncbi:MAG: GDP-mannose 4,6-dehydratase [Candidatus Marinimicrobia bacterium]|nr:GDP-mannose 4,6-dehydratase [Candidatus Neomarinimicrobiota bacterium]